MLGRCLIDVWLIFGCKAIFSSSSWTFAGDTDIRLNMNALPVPCIHRFLVSGVFCVVFGVVLSSLLDASKTVLEANMASNIDKDPKKL